MDGHLILLLFLTLSQCRAEFREREHGSTPHPGTEDAVKGELMTEHVTPKKKLGKLLPVFGAAKKTAAALLPPNIILLAT
jgi:hypothetical protein